VSVSRRLVIFIAMFALFVQSITLMAPGIATGQAPLDHLMLHAQATDHHHHDDHSLHQEDRGESAQHSHADGGLFNFILPSGPAMAVLTSSARHVDVTNASFPRPILDGPYKPPRQA
jgi:hypothetical protein